MMKTSDAAAGLSTSGRNSTNPNVTSSTAIARCETEHFAELRSQVSALASSSLLPIWWRPAGTAGIRRSLLDQMYHPIWKDGSHQESDQVGADVPTSVMIVGFCSCVTVVMIFVILADLPGRSSPRWRRPVRALAAAGDGQSKRLLCPGTGALIFRRAGRRRLFSSLRAWKRNRKRGTGSSWTGTNTPEPSHLPACADRRSPSVARWTRTPAPPCLPPARFAGRWRWTLVGGAFETTSPLQKCRRRDSVGGSTGTTLTVAALASANIFLPWCCRCGAIGEESGAI